MMAEDDQEVDERPRLSIESALQWAFAVEHAQLDFGDEIGRDAVPSFGVEYVLLQRHQMGGVSIDSSRYKPDRTHIDADVLAAAVATLPQRFGGKGMALVVWHHARLGTRPDWLEGAVAKIAPKGWRQVPNIGRVAQSEILRTHVVETKVPHPRYRTKQITRRVKVEERWTPIYWEMHPDQIRDHRRGYTAWRNALVEILDRVEQMGGIESRVLTERLPPDRPWLEPGSSSH